MQDLVLYVYKKYGLLLSKVEIEELIEWYNDNKEVLVSEDVADKETRRYLYEKYKGRKIQLHEEDLSNMKYLLSILKEKSKEKRNER